MTKQNCTHNFITHKIFDENIIEIPKWYGIANTFSLGNYSGEGNLFSKQKTNLKLNPGIVSQIAEKLGLSFVSAKDTKSNVCFANNTDLRTDYKTTFASIDILDYITAVLHSPTYREKHKDFLKIDFPKVPYPKNTETFWELVNLGSKIRQIQLLEFSKKEDYMLNFPIGGDNVVRREMNKSSLEVESIVMPQALCNEVTGEIWINDVQYFDNVPLVAWEFDNGDYMPAQKWLKDREGCELKGEDILDYQKIIVILTETHRLINAINTIQIE